MAQYTEKDLIATYQHREIASGDRAKWDHANYYTYIILKEDGSFLKTKQQGRLTAIFSYEYGTWTVEENFVVLKFTHEARDKKQYHQTNDEDRYHNNPYSEELEKETRTNPYFSRVEIVNPYGKIRGLKGGEDLYERW